MSQVEALAAAILEDHVGGPAARCVLALSAARARVSFDALQGADIARLTAEIDRALEVILHDREMRVSCVQKVFGLLRSSAREEGLDAKSETVAIRTEADVLSARSMGRQIAQGIGFSASAEVQVVTAISELARNIVVYAGQGEIRIAVLDGSRRGIEIVAQDRGPGISNVDEILSGKYRSKTGLGMGLRGTRSLMDEFELATSERTGTRITARKFLR